MAYPQDERRAHWVKLNHQNRVPKRWVAFDTESRSSRTKTGSVQTWRAGVAAKWRTDLKRGTSVGYETFHTPEELWQWVTEFCHAGERTVVWAHNLGYDIRVSNAMEILPTLGWRLDWCNLSSNVSTMTWRSDRGTLVFADSFTWLPMGLDKIGELVGLPKLDMPDYDDGLGKWVPYCQRDVEILVKAVQEIIQFVKDQDLGNWQPTGAGMAFATWRHRFLKHKILVHDDEGALRAERKAMHTGRAEAWRHGKLRKDTWAEVDLRQAYVRIAASHELPTKLKFHAGQITPGQYRQLRRNYCVLARVDVHTTVPCVPVRSGNRELWPIGRFTTWLWDAEIDVALGGAESVRILECYTYTRAPILSEWAQWILEVQGWSDERATPAVKRYIKHSGRALIGRIALRTAQWAVWGANPQGESGVSYEVEADTGRVFRLMHVGNETLREEARIEGRDSLPQITGYIMAMCRVWLWEAMCAAGTDNIAHVDTDSLIVNLDGLRRLREHYGERFDVMWQLKSQYQKMDVYGPRNYRGGNVRKTAGIPLKATETTPNRFTGESWSSMAKDMSEGRMGSVTVTERDWTVNVKDPRRVSLPGGSTRTRPVIVDQSSNASVSSAVADAGGS